MCDSKKMINVNFEKKLYLTNLEFLRPNSVLYRDVLSTESHQKHKDFYLEL
mgnify:CR=1 FL=1